MHARWGSTQIEMLRDASGEHTLASGPSLEQLAEPPPMRGETRGPHHRRWAVPIRKHAADCFPVVRILSLPSGLITGGEGLSRVGK